jgi:hypothetical protein
MSTDSNSISTPRLPRNSSPQDDERSIRGGIEWESEDSRRHEHDPTKPEADMLEQELPLDNDPELLVPDPERVIVDDGGYDYVD